MKKTIISFLTSVVVLSMLIITPAKATENTVDFATQNGQVVVTLNVTDANKEALSLKASFQIKAVTGEINDGDVQFLFDESIQNVVKEYRYDSGVLSIYISGKQDLFENQQVKLGIIDVNLTDDTKVEISLVEESIEYVSSTYAKDELAATSSSVQLGEDSLPPSEDQENDNDSSSSEDQEGENGSSSDSSEDQEGDNDPSSDSSEDEDTDNDISSEEQTPSVEGTEDTNDNSNNMTSSGVQTGDTANIKIYAYMLVVSLVIVAFIARRTLQRRQ